MEEGGGGPRLFPRSGQLAYVWLIGVFLLGLGLRFFARPPEAGIDQSSRLTERLALLARHGPDLSYSTRRNLLQIAEQLETEPDRLRVLRDEEVTAQSMERMTEGFRLLADYQAIPEASKEVELIKRAGEARDRLELTMVLLGALLACALVWSLFGRKAAAGEAEPMTDLPAGRIVAVFMVWDVLNLFVVSSLLGALNIKAHGALVLTLASQVMAYGLMLFLLWRYKEPGAGWNLRLPIPLARVGRGYFLCYALVLASNLVLGPLRGDAPPSSNPLLGFFMQASPPEIAILAVLVVFVGPFFEELMFRGWLLGGLRQHWGEDTAILVSSGLFAAIHADLWATPALFLLGCVFSKVYLRTGTLWASVLLHCMWNASTLVLLLASMP